MDRRRGAIVEHRVEVGADRAGIVLEGGQGAEAFDEGRVLAAERPTHLAGRGIDVVGGPGVATRDKQRAVGVEVDRVEVEEVERPLRRTGGGARVGLAQRHVIQ